MKIHGYCTECHRIRRVRVSNQGMAMLAARNVASGICDECQQREDDARRERHARRTH